MRACARSTWARRSVAELLAVDNQRVDHRLERVEGDARDGEGHLHVQQVPEDAETGVEQDVADFGNHLARPHEADLPERNRPEQPVDMSQEGPGLQGRDFREAPAKLVAAGKLP